MENLEKITKEELCEINGGIWDKVLIAVMIAVFRDWENFKAGFNGEPPV